MHEAKRQRECVDRQRVKRNSMDGSDEGRTDKARKMWIDGDTQWMGVMKDGRIKRERCG